MSRQQQEQQDDGNQAWAEVGLAEAYAQWLKDKDAQAEYESWLDSLPQSRYQQEQPCKSTLTM